jgi:hypothetical protein
VLRINPLYEPVAAGSLPPPFAGEGGPRVSEGRERGATVQEKAAPFMKAASLSEAGFPSPDPLRGPPSPAGGGGSSTEPEARYVIRWPSERYEAEYAPRATYPLHSPGPETLTFDGTPDAPETQRVRVREFVDLPERW